MAELTPKQKKRLERYAKSIEDEKVANIEIIEELEDKLEEISSKLDNVVSITDGKLSCLSEELKKKLESELVLEIDKEELKGEKGDNYELDDDDKKEIASLIEVPIIEKIIEKVEVIKELPIITNQIIKESSETTDSIREKVTSTDVEWLPSKQIIGFKGIESKIKDLENRPNITQVIGNPTGNSGLEKIKLNGVDVKQGVSEINFTGSGLTATRSSNGVNIHITAGEVAIGESVLGGSPNEVLYIDPSGKLAGSSNFTYIDNTAQQFKLGQHYSGGSATVADLAGEIVYDPDYFYPDTAPAVHDFYIRGYFIQDGIKIYSDTPAYIQFQFSGTPIDQNYTMKWSWTNPEGFDGFVIIGSDDYYGGGSYYLDIGNVLTWTQSFASWDDQEATPALTTIPFFWRCDTGTEFRHESNTLYLGGVNLANHNQATGQLSIGTDYSCTPILQLGKNTFADNKYGSVFIGDTFYEGNTQPPRLTVMANGLGATLMLDARNNLGSFAITSPNEYGISTFDVHHLVSPSTAQLQVRRTNAQDLGENLTCEFTSYNYTTPATTAVAVAKFLNSGSTGKQILRLWNANNYTDISHDGDFLINNLWNGGNAKIQTLGTGTSFKISIHNARTYEFNYNQFLFSSNASSQTQPHLAFLGELNTGLGRFGNGQLNFTVGGTEVARFTAGQFETVLGTASAPSYSFIGDLNTGMWSPTADAISWSTGGTEQGGIRSSIWTLGVYNASYSKLRLNVFGTAGLPATTGTTQLGSLRLYNSATNNVLDFGNSSSSPYGSWIQSTDASALGTYYPLLLNPRGGNVGIGTTAPLVKTHIVDTTDTALLLQYPTTTPGIGTGIRFSVVSEGLGNLYSKAGIFGVMSSSLSGGYGKTDILFCTDNTNDSSLVTTDDVRMRIRYDGAVIMNGKFVSFPGATSSSALIYQAHIETDDNIAMMVKRTTNSAGAVTGIGFHVANTDANTYGKLAIFAEGASSGYGRGKLHLCSNIVADSSMVSKSDAVLTVDENGNVGIGITSPTSKLHVQVGTDSTNTTTPVAFNVNSNGANGEMTASSGTQIWSQFAPTINQSGTAGYTANRIYVTETATGSGAKLLADWQVGGVSKFSVDNTGEQLLAGRSRYVGTYAEIYVADGSTAQSIPNGTTYTKLTAFTTNGSSSNCTADATNDKITITKAGKYLVNCTVSGFDGATGAEFKMALFYDGTEQNNIHSTNKFNAGSEIDEMTMSGIIVASANKDIDVRMRHDNVSSVNFTTQYANLTITYIGE